MSRGLVGRNGPHPNGLLSGVNGAVALVFAENRLEAEGAFTGISSVIGVPDDSVLDVSGEKWDELKSVFGVSDKELGAVRGPAEEALMKLIVERGALLPLRR